MIFRGAVVIVSHDRYFLDRLVVKTFAFEEDGNIRQYTGGYSKYMNEKDAREAARASGSSSGSTKGNGPGNTSSSESRRHERRRLKFSYREQKEYETIDDDIAALEQRAAEIDSEMEAHASEALKLADLAKEKESVEQQLDEKMERWEYLNELAERISRGELV